MFINLTPAASIFLQFTLAGIFLVSCDFNSKNKHILKPEIQLIKSSLITNFPSGSSINYYNGKLYLIGDDANNVLVLNKDYTPIDSIQLFNYPEKRIPKSEKTDFETSTLLELNGTPQLLVIGSGSREERKKALLLPVAHEAAASATLFQPFFYNEASFAQLKTKGIAEVNIEGSTIIGDHLALSNRGNIANPWNHLIITQKDGLVDGSRQSFTVQQLRLPVNAKEFIGVSELCYIESNDILLFALSSEATNNSYDDGVIGDSYIGWIHNFSEKMDHPELIVDEMINLRTINDEFEKEKIEGLCVEAVNGNEFTIHLISDNDSGESKLFKVKVIMNGDL